MKYVCLFPSTSLSLFNLVETTNIKKSRCLHCPFIHPAQVYKISRYKLEITNIQFCNTGKWKGYIIKFNQECENCTKTQFYMRKRNICMQKKKYLYVEKERSVCRNRKKQIMVSWCCVISINIQYFFIVFQKIIQISTF